MKLPRGMHNGSILPFFNAAGRCPLLVIILPLEFGDADVKSANIYMLPEQDVLNQVVGRYNPALTPLPRPGHGRGTQGLHCA